MMEITLCGAMVSSTTTPRHCPRSIVFCDTKYNISISEIQLCWTFCDKMVKGDIFLFVSSKIMVYSQIVPWLGQPLFFEILPGSLNHIEKRISGIHCAQVRNCARDPSWLCSPKQTSPKIQCRSISGLIR